LKKLEVSLQKRKRLFVIIGVVAVALVITGLVIYPKLKQVWEQPLGPSLGLETLEPAATPTEIVAASNPDETTGETVSTAQPPTPTPEPLCGGPMELVILAIGTDSRSDNYLYGTADVMRLIHVDFVIPRVAVLTIPRDLWVEVPGVSDHYGLTHAKLNQSYFYGTPGMGYYDGPGEGAGLLARTLDVNFGLRIDRYGAVNMRTFEDIIDAVGGVDVYLEQAVDGRVGDSEEDNMGLFKAGWHHLTGEAALRFARIRKVDSVFARDNRQTQILCAFKEKVLSPDVVTGIPEMISAFSGRVITDLSPAELSRLACLAPRLTQENLVFASLPQEMLDPARVNVPGTNNYTFIWDVDFDLVADYIDRFLAGTWPEPSADDGGMSCSEFKVKE
jgi:LCP family protein required for cell wall assembly